MSIRKSEDIYLYSKEMFTLSQLKQCNSSTEILIKHLKSLDKLKLPHPRYINIISDVKVFETGNFICLQG